MLDPPPGDAKPTPPHEIGADRDMKVEQLLLTGLDHYFNGQYDRAIDVWTRVLFLDRSHARARAYIERARSALAERLRESEELLHTGVEAFNRGDASEARQLLTTAVERGGGRDEALAILDRLNRLEAAAGNTGAVVHEERPVATRRGRRLVTPPRPPRQRRPLVPLLVLVGVVASGAYLGLSWERWVPALLPASDPPALTPAAGLRVPLPVPSVAEVALARARRLVDEGRGREALRLLSAIGPGDPLRLDADALRIAIQQELLTPGPEAPEAGNTPAERDQR